MGQIDSASSGYKHVPFFDWPSLYLEHRDEYLKIFDRTASSGGFILRGDVEQFEQDLAQFIGVRHVVGLADATNAMLLGLRASDLKPGAEVIVPSHGFIAAGQAVHFAGGITVPVELSESDWLIDPDAVRAAITPRTQAIMPVQINGRVARMDLLAEIADEYGLQLFEDSAQALGASLDGISAGCFGKWGVFSFYPSKTLGCFGDAGALVTNDDEIAERVRRMRNHGANQQRVIEPGSHIWGTNARLDNIHAATLVYKLTWYTDAIARRRAIASRYHEAFRKLPSLSLPPAPNSDSRYFDVFQNYELCTNDRDSLRKYLESRGVGTIVQWGGLGMHQHIGLGFEATLPKTERFFRRSMLIPMNHLLSDKQVDHVIDSVVDYFKEYT